MQATAVVDLENTGYPDGGGWSRDFDLGAVMLDESGTEVDSFTASGPGREVGKKFSTWLNKYPSAAVTSYNQDFDRRRLTEGCGLSGLDWGPDIKDLAAKAVNQAGEQESLPNGFAKWPTLDEAAEHFGLESGDRAKHSPVADARLAAQVLVKARAGRPS